MDRSVSTKDLLKKWLDAAERGDADFVVEQLNRGLVATPDHISEALMRAASGGQIALMRILLARGADPNFERGYSTSVTAGLLCAQRGCDVRPGVIPDPRPLELLLASGGRYRIQEAVQLNDIEIVRERLDEGANVNTWRDEYFGPILKIAARLGHLEIVELLIERGADLEAMDDLGGRPLMAPQSGQTQVVKMLLSHGAEIDAVDEIPRPQRHLPMLHPEAIATWWKFYCRRSPGAA